MKKRKFKIRHLLAGVLICYIGYILVNQQIIINCKKSEIVRYNEQQQKIQQMNDKLKDEINFAGSDEYKEKEARERIGLIGQNETVYIFDKQN